MLTGQDHVTVYQLTQSATAVFVLACSGTAWFSSRFKPFRMLDVPNDRSLHAVPIPRSGGIAVVVSLALGMAYLWVRNSLQSPLAIGCAAAVLVSVISFIDDMHTLTPLLRLVVQVFAGAIAMSAGIHLSTINLQESRISCHIYRRWRAL